VKLLLALSLVLMAACTAGGAVNTMPHAEPLHEVPDVVGFDRPDAVETVRKAGLRPSPEAPFSPGRSGSKAYVARITEGWYVAKQTPAPGTWVAERAQVTLVFRHRSRGRGSSD
jgi:beta-lactam-binding protein with PASTA domain